MTAEGGLSEDGVGGRLAGDGDDGQITTPAGGADGGALGITDIFPGRAGNGDGDDGRMTVSNHMTCSKEPEQSSSVRLLLSSALEPEQSSSVRLPLIETFAF